MFNVLRRDNGVNLAMKQKKKPQAEIIALNQPLEELKHKKVAERVEALESLAKIDDPTIVKEVIKALSDRSPTVRGTAVEWLGALGTREAITPLIMKLEDPDSEVRMMATASLGDLLVGKKTPQELVRKLQDSAELVRIEAAESLGAIGDKSTLPELWSGLEDKSPLVRSYMAGAIGELGSTKDIPELEERLRKEKSDTSKVGYYQALYKLGKRDVVDQMLHMLSDSKNYRVRCAVSKILVDTVDNKNSALIIQRALQKALRLEPTNAAKSSIRSSIRNITQRFVKRTPSRRRGGK